MITQRIIKLLLVLIFFTMNPVESSLTGRNCTEDEFKCDNGKCIKAEWFCNRYDHCGDGSDEVVYDEHLHSRAEGIRCVGSGPLGYDAYDICLLSANQTHKAAKLCRADSKCLENEFVCPNRNICVRKYGYCDDIDQCRDGSDEIVYNPSIHTIQDGIPCVSRSSLNRNSYSICLLPKSQSQKAATLCSRTEPNCTKDEFECSNQKRCVTKRGYCDRKSDCGDGSDETIYDKSLHTTEDGVSCTIPKLTTFVYDSCLLPINQIYKAESLCSKTGDLICNNDEFACADQKACVTYEGFCDTVNDCGDNSDEVTYNASLHSLDDGVPCVTDNIISTDDSYNICFLRKNQNLKPESICIRTDPSCLDDEFECPNQKRCVRKKWFCDGEPSCGDGSDEILFSRRKHKALGIPCRSSDVESACLLPWKYVCDGGSQCFDNSDECNCEKSKLYCDGTSDCPFGTDECFCSRDGTRTNTTYLDEQCFRCLDGSKILPLSQLCDGVIHCDDFSDECLCITKNGDRSLPLCKEALCWGDDCSKCSKMCGSLNDSQCLSNQHICNGRIECKEAIDEKHCEKLSGASCTDSDDTDISETKCDFTCKRRKGKRTKKCDGVPECKNIDDECHADCKTTKLKRTLPEYCRYARRWYFGTITDFFCVRDRKRLKGYNVCDNVAHCNPEIPWHSEDEINCPYKFYCKHFIPLHIPIEKLCDFVKDCIDESDELGCSNRTHFYCNDGGTTTYIKQDVQICDGNEDCESASDECQDCTQGVFSSDEAMISTKPLIPFLYIISIIATVGNTFAISFTIKKMVMKGKKKATKIEKSQNMMILSLSVADMFVSIYTAVIIIENEILSKDGRYCLKDQEWRSGTTCSAIGIFIMAGSEASVFTLIVITAYRLKSTLRPFDKPAPLKVSFWLCLSWICAITLAAIPLSPVSSIEDYFVESIWFDKNHFLSTIQHEHVGNFTKKLLVLKNKTSDYIEEHGSIGSWQLVEALLQEFNPQLVPRRKFGYYSTHGVCLPRLFPDREDTAWAYSFIIILINFAAFVFIFFGYVIIFKMATKVTVQKTSSRDRDSKLQRKVTVIVITDFCCWVPIAFMGFLQLSGVDIPNEVYVPVGTILIPINSAVNPIIYSDALVRVWNKLSPARSWLQDKASSIQLSVWSPLSKTTSDGEKTDGNEFEGENDAARKADQQTSAGEDSRQQEDMKLKSLGNEHRNQDESVQAKGSDIHVEVYETSGTKRQAMEKSLAASTGDEYAAKKTQ